MWHNHFRNRPLVGFYNYWTLQFTSLLIKSILFNMLLYNFIFNIFADEALYKNVVYKK